MPNPNSDLEKINTEKAVTFLKDLERIDRQFREYECGACRDAGWVLFFDMDDECFRVRRCMVQIDKARNGEPAKYSHLFKDQGEKIESNNKNLIIKSIEYAGKRIEKTGTEPSLLSKWTDKLISFYSLGSKDKNLHDLEQRQLFTILQRMKTLLKLKGVDRDKVIEEYKEFQQKTEPAVPSEKKVENFIEPPSFTYTPVPRKGQEKKYLFQF